MERRDSKSSGREGERWLDIDMPAGGVIFNTGALMARWTKPTSGERRLIA
jgi:isopenicillin N synthase-like dioxygenase